MGLSKNITLTIKDYEIKLDKEIKFYENDTIDLCFSILEYGIEVKDGISINKLMPIQALRSYMLIETPHGIDYAESTKIEDNKIVFNLGTKYSQFVGIGRMQIVVKDSDGCRVTLPEFEFEIKESINMNWDRESFDFLATEDDSIIIDEFGRKIHMSKISDMPESENISEESYAMIIDEEGNKRFKVRAIADAVEHSLDAKFNAYTDEINSDVEEFKGSVRTDITTFTNENNTFKNQVNISLANYGSDYNNFKDNVEARLGEHMTDYNRFKDGVETRIEESESTYDGFVSDVSTVLDNYGSTYNAFKNEVDKANTSFRNTLNASNQVFKNEMVDRYDNFIYKIDEDIFEGGRTDYFGETHEKIGERLDLDFDVVHQRINDSGLMEYEGCNITANNTYYGRQKDTIIKGRTLQNLRGNDGEIHGEWKNGEITFKPSEGTHRFINFCFHLTQPLKNSTQYTIVYFIKTNTLSYEFIACEGGDSSSQTIGLTRSYLPIGSTGVVKHLITTKSEGNCTYLSAFCTNNMSGEITFYNRPLLLEGDYTQTPLEELPYIEGIESSGDKSKNLVKSMVVDMEHSDGNYVRCEGSYAERSSIIKLPKGKYSLSFEKFDSSEILDGGLCIWDNTGSTTWKRRNSNMKNFEILEDEVGITWYGSFSTKEKKDEVVGSFIQIEEGETTTPYQEYYDGYKISGKSHGKNLLKINNYKCIFPTSGYTGTEDLSIIKKNIKVKPNTTYCLRYSELDDNSSIKVITSNYPLDVARHNDAYVRRIREITVYREVEFTTSENENYITLTIGNLDCTIKNYFDFTDFQLEESTTPTEYEPYKESTYSYILNEPLRSLPNGVCDTIDLETGVLTRRVGKVVFDGNIKGELVTVEASINGTVRYLRVVNIIELQNLKQVIDYNNHICDKLPVLNPYLNNTNCISVIYRKDVPEFDSEFRLCLTGTEINTQDYINWLNENPLTIYFELETPITEQLTPQQLKSFDSTTHVISENKLMSIVSTKMPTDLGAMVNTLSLRNGELEEINKEQDELIDITMMATDEMYSMLEPLMEAVEPMGLLDCSKMAQMYVAMVRRGIKKIEDVPRRYQEEVREVLGIKIEEEEWGEDDGIK